jgi:hypothetical protein
MILGDVKVLCTLLGQQHGYTKYTWFMFEWESREEVNTGSTNIGHKGHLLNLGARTF